jgi:LysM repeat protein
MFSPNPKNDPLLAAIKGVIAENDKHRDAVDLVNHYFQITDKRQLPHNLHAQYDKMLSESTVIAEKITKSTPMGDVIRDFEKSDAPQFEGKSMEKRRQMAIAAKMAMNEALKGNQHKIDANKNGKVDAQDFKMLRKDMTAEEIMKEAIFNLSEKDSLSEAEVNFLMELDVTDTDVMNSPLYDRAVKSVKDPRKIQIGQEVEGLGTFKKGDTIFSRVKEKLASEKITQGAAETEADRIRQRLTKFNPPVYEPAGVPDDTTRVQYSPTTSGQAAITGRGYGEAGVEDHVGPTAAGVATQQEIQRKNRLLSLTKESFTGKKNFSEEVKYKVKKGDTLYDLAKEYGTTVDAIAKASGVKDKNKISIDQELVIPGQAAPPQAAPPVARYIDSGRDFEVIKQQRPVNTITVPSADGERLIPISVDAARGEEPPRFKPPVFAPANLPPDKFNPPVYDPAGVPTGMRPRNARPANVTARPDTQTGAGANFGQTDTSPPLPPLPRARPTPKSPTPPVPVDANTVRDSQKRYALDMFKNVANAADFDGEKFVNDLTSRYNLKVEPRDVPYDALKIQSSDDTKSILAQSLGISYPELTRILGRSKAPVTATPDTQTGAGGDYSQVVKSTKPESGLTTRNVTTVPVDKYGNLIPTGPEAAAKAKSAWRAGEIDAWTKPQWKAPARTSNPLTGPNGMTGTSGRAVASAAFSRGAADADAAVRQAAAQNSSAFSRGAADADAAVAYSRGAADADAAVRQAAAQRTVDSTTAALAANDRGSNMTSSAASIEAQKLAKRIATKTLEAQRNEIIKVPANSYQPETRAAQEYRIDNIGREVAKRSEENKKRTDLQTNLNTYVNR